MSVLEVGQQAPDFTLKTNGDGELTLSTLRGKNIALYFYPKDMTPGCTTESKDFRDLLPEFTKLGVTVIGISKDSVQRHDKFVAKYELPFKLVSDEEGTACEAYGVWQLKKFMGKSYMGIVRTTFLIDADGKIAEIWDNVRVKGHAAEVLARAKSL